MNYTLRKVGFAAFCGLFFIIGCILLVNSFGVEDATPFIGCMFMVISVAAGTRYWLLMTKFETKNYTWYAAQHPECVQGDRVQCASCSSRDIRVRNLMNKTFHRAHLCGKCGATLYYSPEV